MKSKKKQILIGVSSLFIIILGIGLYLWFNKDNDTQVYENNREQVKEQISGFNGISMMYETGPDTGEYSESKSSLWPESGYIFNDNLSGCENGGELSWNDELGAVTLHSNKSDSCYVYFDMYIIPVINSVITSNIETDSITLTVNVTNGNNPVTTYYYSNNNGSSYVSSNSNTYTFSGLDMGTVYNFSVYVEDSEGYASEAYTLSETTDDIVLLADWVISQYGGVQGNNGIYYHTSSLANSAADNSYRYSGANPNNYVCFGSDATSCPSDSLYRIIGVFGNEVKLIKWDYANSDLLGTGGAYSSGTYSASSYGNYNGAHSTVNRYYWNIGTGGGFPPIASTIWSKSILNTMHLNGTYLNNIGSTWQNKIATHSWKVGGASWDNMYNGTPRTAYNYEVGANSSTTTYSAKIGLMYVSDYGFAAIPDYWTSTLVDHYSNNASTFSNNNWMYMGMREWTISRIESYGQTAFAVYDAGYISFNDVYDSMSESAVRPSFYLESSVIYVSGTGTQSDPFRIQ